MRRAWGRLAERLRDHRVQLMIVMAVALPVMVVAAVTARPSGRPNGAGSTTTARPAGPSWVSQDAAGLSTTMSGPALRVAPTGNTTASTSRSTRATSSTASTTTRREPGVVSRVVIWLQGITPDSGGNVAADRVQSYNDLARDDCDQVLQDYAEPEDLLDRLYRGAARGCLAAFHGRTSLWSGAVADARAAEGLDQDQLTCVDRAVLGVLRQLVAVHQRSPATVLVRGDAGGGELSCARITALVPDHGPAEGGYEVVATGTSLPSTVRILVDEELVTGRSDPAGTRVTFTMPPAPPDRLEEPYNQTYVQTVDWPGYPVLFTYDLTQTPPTGGGGGGNG